MLWLYGSVPFQCRALATPNRGGQGKTYRIKGFRLLQLRETRRKRCRGR